MRPRGSVARVFLVVICGFSLSLMAETPEDAKTAFDRGDYATALRVWRDLAAQGNAQAQYSLGSMYAAGRGVTKDYAEAARWMRQAAGQGLAPAQYDLGIMYRDGLGVAKDDAEAMRWYRKAADQGIADAQHNLGVRYERGVGVNKDDTEAVRWFRKAADQGLAVSQFNLGLMYADGRGVSQNLVEAYKWLSLAAQGVQASQGAQVVARRDQLAKTLTSVQIAQADYLAREWRPSGEWGSPYSAGFYASNLPEGEGSAVAAGQLVDMGSYSVRAPLGDGWSLQTDQNYALVMFRKVATDGGYAWINVGQNTLGPQVDVTTEEGIAATIQRFEEANMRARGATRSYASGEMKMEAETIGEKKLYVMRYKITDRSRGFPIEVMYAMYVYLPPDVKQTRRVYLFLIGQPRKAGESEIGNNLPEIYPVIRSFQEK